MLTNEQRLAKALKILSEAWTPHDGQVQVGQAVFNSPADLVYVECGRKFGKSEVGTYICWMYAVTHPNAEVYYLAPAVKQAKELVWANNRMQTCNSYSGTFLKDMEKVLGGEIKIYQQEMRIVLPNGSFIKIDGSDNYNSQRGFKPDLVVADEYRDFKEEWIEAVRPNMAVKSGKILFITTPPHGPNHAYEMAAECREGVRDGDAHYFYLNLPSKCNNRIPGHKEWLKREEQRLIKQGRQNEWRREYMAEFISNDEHAVIPQMNRDNITPNRAILNELRQNIDHLEVHVGIDPSNSTQFAAVTAIFDPVAAKLHLWDSIYQQDAERASARCMWPVIEAKLQGMYKIVGLTGQKRKEPDVNVHVSPYAPWMIRDLFEIHGVHSNLSNRTLKDPIHNIGLIKDMLAARSLTFGPECLDLIKEAEMYQRSQKTLKIPKDQKPLINCVRQIVSGCNYTTEMIEVEPDLPEDQHFLEQWEQKVSFEDKMRELRAEHYGIIPDEEELWPHWEKNELF